MPLSLNIPFFIQTECPTAPSCLYLLVFNHALPSPLVSLVQCVISTRLIGKKLKKLTMRYKLGGGSGPAAVSSRMNSPCRPKGGCVPGAFME